MPQDNHCFFILQPSLTSLLFINPPQSNRQVSFWDQCSSINAARTRLHFRIKFLNLMLTPSFTSFFERYEQIAPVLKNTYTGSLSLNVLADTGKLRLVGEFLSSLDDIQCLLNSTTQLVMGSAVVDDVRVHKVHVALEAALIAIHADFKNEQGEWVRLSSFNTLSSDKTIDECVMICAIL